MQEFKEETTDIVSLYKQKKRLYIQMRNNLIRSSNYKSYRALESDDFIVNDVILDANTIHILNSMYKHPVFDINPNIICKYSFINNIVNNYKQQINLN